RALNGVSVAYRSVYPSLEFNGVTGALKPDQTELKTPSVSNASNNVLTSRALNGVSVAYRSVYPSLEFNGVTGALKPDQTEL
ncbi:hypothetical protein D9B85_15345, partial [Corynebacterium diphtheriae]